jgi:ferredoxin
LTPPEVRTREFPREFPEMRGELAIIGAPVYAGRVPAEAVNRLRLLRANDNPAVVVVVYGNREYEDALLELRDIAVEVGFRPIAGGAFIGEHSFDSEATPIATGRPDAEDLRRAAKFGEMIREKVEKIQVLDEVQPPRVPGNFPYRERMDEEATSPVTRALCTMCGECVKVCPTGAIAVGDCAVIDRSLCILCSACVKLCPTGAMVWEDPRVKRAAKWLSVNYAERKEPEMYL